MHNWYPNLLYMAMTKHQNQRGEESVYFSFQLQVHHAGKAEHALTAGI